MQMFLSASRHGQNSAREQLVICGIRTFVGHESALRPGLNLDPKEFAMSSHPVAHKFVEMCSQLKNFDVIRTMYAPDIVSVEGDGTETRGQQEVIHKSEVWQGKNGIHSERVRGPYFNGLNQFAVHFTFEITPKRTGKRVTLEEVGVYTVKGDKVTREQFFYDGER